MGPTKRRLLVEAKVLVNMLADKGGNKGWELAAKLKGNGAGRGRAHPLATRREGQNKGEKTGRTLVPRLVFPQPVTMHLDCQGPCSYLLWRPPPGHPRGLHSLLPSNLGTECNMRP